MTIEKVGKRISLDGELGTVRFYGEVPEGSGKFWYGIEWDNQTRGKHSGTHEGVRYFECEVDGSGSFLKPNSKMHFGVDFVEALNEKYSFDRLKYESKIQSLSLEVNVDKRSRDGPKQIGLIGDKVAVAKQPVPESVSLNLEDLDLSSNLFASFDDILDILTQLPNLKVLRLNFNRFKISNTHDRETCFKNLRVLSLNFTRTTWDSYASCLSPYFDQLEELYLVSNGINSLKVSSDNLNCLKVLNLDKNLMTEWSEISYILGKLPSLESLSLEENNISSIMYESGTFTALKQLNLSANPISSYDSIDVLNSFPSLKELRLKNIPLFVGLKSGETRIQVVSRIGKLVQFNGSEIRDRDRKDDELYYLGIIHKQVYNSSCAGDKENIIKANPRYRELIDFYGEPAVSKETKNQLKNDLLHMEFCLSDDTVLGKKTFPKSTSLRIVRMYAQKLLNQQKKGKISFMTYKGDIEVELNDDFKSLDFYGLSPKSAEDVFRILVQTDNVVDPPAEIYMGKDKYENDDLIKQNNGYTLPTDIWFHVDKLSSAHVYLRIENPSTDKKEWFKDIKEELIVDCAQLTKANSIEGNKKDNITIVYTPVSNLKKTKGMETGQVSFKSDALIRKVLVKQKENAIVNRLNKTKREESIQDLVTAQIEKQKKITREKKQVYMEQLEIEKEVKKQRDAEKALRSYDHVLKEDLMESNLDQVQKYVNPETGEVDAEAFEDDFM